MNCAKSGFGIKAKRGVHVPATLLIVQRADLESRQSPKRIEKICERFNAGEAKTEADKS